METQNSANDAALALRDSPREAWREPDWQKLWLAIRGQPWSSLALVPAASGAPPDFTVTIAVTLARVGILHLGTPIRVADATRIPLVHLEQFTEEIRSLGREEDPILIALPTVDDTPMTVSLAQAADAAVACVLLGKMGVAESKRTVERIGPSRFIGSIVFHPDDKTEAKKTR